MRIININDCVLGDSKFETKKILFNSLEACILIDYTNGKLDGWHFFPAPTFDLYDINCNLLYSYVSVSKLPSNEKLVCFVNKSYKSAKLSLHIKL